MEEPGENTASQLGKMGAAIVCIIIQNLMKYVGRF